MLEKLLKELDWLKDQEKSKQLQRYFKTWVWEYWEWDIFLWISVPNLRNLSKKYLNLSKQDLKKLLVSKIHEHRFMALTIIRWNYEKAVSIEDKKDLFDFSLENIFYINNWDLVDTFTPYVIWNFLFDREKILLYKLVKSSNLWERRIAILSTFYFIKNSNFEDTLKICEILLNDKYDLIHKACGWGLREVWKKNEKVLLDFLDKHYKVMPRTMLRYSIEKLNKEQRGFYMAK